MAFLLVKISEMFMTAIFYAFQQKWKVIQKKKSRNNSEIWQRDICRWKTLYKQGKEEI